MSKKLRAGIILSRMNLVAVEAPAPGVAFARKASEFCDAALGIVYSGYGLEVVTDELVQALAQGFGLFAGAGDQLVVEG